MIVAAPLSLIALLAGWTTTEVGRQPWIAWHVMRTTDAVTSARGLPFAYAFLALVYIGLTVVAVWLLRRVAREEPTRMPSVPASVARAMTLPDVCSGLMVGGLTAYAALGGADFGAGFWDLVAGGPERGARVRGLVQRSMAPVWEANHVWLIFVLVVFWTAFPRAFGAVMSALYVPLFLAAIGIILRGASYAIRDHATTIGGARVLGGTFALSSVLTPFFLGAAIGAVASGSVPLAGAGAPFSAWVHPLPVFAGALAVVTGTHLAAVYMAGDAAHLGLDDLRRGFRARALVTGAVAGALAIGGLAVVHADAPALYHGLTTGAGLRVRGRLGRRGRRGARPRGRRPLRRGALQRRGRRRRRSRSAGASPSIRRCFPAA